MYFLHCRIHAGVSEPWKFSCCQAKWKRKAIYKANKIIALTLGRKDIKEREPTCVHSIIYNWRREHNIINPKTLIFFLCFYLKQLVYIPLPNISITFSAQYVLNTTFLYKKLIITSCSIHYYSWVYCVKVQNISKIVFSE